MKIKYLYLLFSIVLFLFLCSGCTSFSDKEQNITKNKETLVIGIDENYPPFGFLEDNQFVGFDISLAEKVTKELGMNLEIKSINWADKAELLETGAIDAIWNGLTITEERQEEFLFTDPYMEIQAVLVVRDDSTIESLEDLTDTVIGVQKDSYGQDIFESLPIYDSIDHITYFDDNRSALKNLYVGLTDAVVVDSALADWYIYSSNADYKVVDSIEDIKIGVAFAKDNVELRNKINNTLNILKENGIAQQISEEWFGQDLILKTDS